MNTQFSATPGRKPHIGHAWLAWLNWMQARMTGGEFVLMWDDIMHRNGVSGSQGYSFENGVSAWREELAWFGIVADREVIWSTHQAEFDVAVEKLGYKLPQPLLPQWPALSGRVRAMINPWFPVWPEPPTVPVLTDYDPALMVCWVLGEHLERIDGYYTGNDFRMSAVFYEDVAHRLGVKPPLRYFIPTVRRASSPEKISKSGRHIDTSDLREAGYEPWKIISTLLECARVSALGGLADVVIPDGVLDPDPVRWLEYQGFVINSAGAAAWAKRPGSTIDVPSYQEDLEERAAIIKREQMDNLRGLCAPPAEEANTSGGC